MKEIILTGGLGNQLFQYAFGRAISERDRSPFCLNTYRLGMPQAGETPRKFALQNLGLACEVIDKPRLYGRNRYMDAAIRKNLIPSYTHETESAGKRFYSGHWLDKKHADSVRQLLLRDFQFQGNLSDNDQAFFTEAKAKSILSVHIRRGDYTDPKIRAYHGALGLKFYEKALAVAKATKNFDEVWCFSDDPAWCETNLPGVRVIKMDNKDPFVDIALMSACKGNIIANSTFSWWGAWLNENPDKLVIAPSRWFKAIPNPPLYAPEWKLVEGLE